MLMYVMLQTAAAAGHRRRLLRAGEVPGRGRGAAGRIQHARDAGESVQYSTVQYSVQYGTVQYNTAAGRLQHARDAGE